MAAAGVVLKQLLVCFPFCRFSSLNLSLSLNEHPFSPAFDKLINKYIHVKYTLPCSIETSKMNALHTVRITLLRWP